MQKLSLTDAVTIIEHAFEHAEHGSFKPIAIAVLDDGGHLKAFAAQDGTSILRPKIAHGKAYGAIALGFGSRRIAAMAAERPMFVDALNGLAAGALIPVPGGVLIKDKEGAIVGAVGITGDTSDNDEACAIVGIKAAGYEAATE